MKQGRDQATYEGISGTEWLQRSDAKDAGLKKLSPSNGDRPGAALLEDGEHAATSDKLFCRRQGIVAIALERPYAES